MSARTAKLVSRGERRISSVNSDESSVVHGYHLSGS